MWKLQEQSKRIRWYTSLVVSRCISWQKQTVCEREGTVVSRHWRRFRVYSEGYYTSWRAASTLRQSSRPQSTARVTATAQRRRSRVRGGVRPQTKQESVLSRKYTLNLLNCIEIMRFMSNCPSCEEFCFGTQQLRSLLFFSFPFWKQKSRKLLIDYISWIAKS